MQLVFTHVGIALTDAMRKKAEAAVRTVATRSPRATGATVWFEEDGPARRTNKHKE